AGRARKEDPVSAAAGVLCLVREGDVVAANEPIFELHADDMAHIVLGRTSIESALVIGDETVTTSPILIERIG
ncbi:MAG: hypothetical protein WA786_10325, partial [Acidimicrobiales bacterium]